MRKHLTYANAMATIAVFIALGGTSYAISVSGGDVVNGSLTGEDVKRNSLTAADVKGIPAKLRVRQGDPATGITPSSEADCFGDERAISGGFSAAGSQWPAATLYDGPVGGLRSGPEGWSATIATGDPAKQVTVRAFVVCAS